MTRKARKRSNSDENIEQNLANYLKRKSLLHQQMLLQQPTPPQNHQRFWTVVSNQLWSLVSKTFKKEARLNENDLFNEACAARLAGLRNSYRIRSRRELDFLLKKTKFSRHEIKLLYLGWKDVCVNGYLDPSICISLYAQFFPQASDSSLYAKHVYRALFSRNNILTNLNNNNNVLITNANNSNDPLTSDEECQRINQRTPSPVPAFTGKQHQYSNCYQNKSRLRSQSTAGFKSSIATNNNQQISTLSSSTTAAITATTVTATNLSNNTLGLLSKRRTQSLAKQTLDSSSHYLENLSKNSNSNLSAIQNELYSDCPLRRSSRNASSANLSSYRDGVPDRISFVEYTLVLSALLKGSLEEKLAWTFQLYDVSGDGKLTVDEIIEISKAIYALLGYYVQPAHDSNTYVEHGKRIFEKIDVNKTGCVNLEQFIACCSKDESITKSLQLITAYPI